MNDDQTFRSARELNKMFSEKGVTKDKEIITYCQLAVRASHTYFTLRMLGYPRVRVYNGSWGEWGNDPNLPVEKTSSNVKKEVQAGISPSCTFSSISLAQSPRFLLLSIIFINH